MFVVQADCQGWEKMKRTWKGNLPIKVLIVSFLLKQFIVSMLFMFAVIHCSQAMTMR